MPDARQRELLGMGLDDLLEALTDPEVGSANHELTKVLIQARVAQLQRDTARDSLSWARLSALAALGASLIALAAFLVAVL